jgi:hypothetical protein
VGGGHPSGAEDGPEVKAGADAPILDRGEGLGQLPDRARHCRRNQNLPRKPDQHSENETQKKRGKDLIERVPSSRIATNLVARELGDLPRAEVEGGRRRDCPAARSARGNRRGASSRGGDGR